MNTFRLTRRKRAAVVLTPEQNAAIRAAEVKCSALAKAYCEAKAELKAMRQAVRQTQMIEEPWLEVTLDGLSEPSVTELTADGQPVGDAIPLQSLKPSMLRFRVAKAIQTVIKKGGHHA